MSTDNKDAQNIYGHRASLLNNNVGYLSCMDDIEGSVTILRIVSTSEWIIFCYVYLYDNFFIIVIVITITIIIIISIGNQMVTSEIRK